MLLFYLLNSKGGIIIENKVLKLKKLIESEDNQIIKKILDDVLKLGIKEIKYDNNLQLSNISEYEFELVKCRIILEENKEVEMYLKMIKNNKINKKAYVETCRKKVRRNI